MNRRHFLGSLAALSAGMALDPELALWVPGRTTYFEIVRPVPVWLAEYGTSKTATRWFKATAGASTWNDITKAEYTALVMTQRFSRVWA